MADELQHNSVATLLEKLRSRFGPGDDAVEASSDWEDIENDIIYMVKAQAVDIQDLKGALEESREKVRRLEARIRTQESPEGEANISSSTALVKFKPPTDEEMKRRRMSIEFGENFIAPSDAPLRVMRAVTGMINTIEWEELAVSYIDTIKASSGNVRREVEEWFDANFPADSSPGAIAKAARDNFKTCLSEVAVKLRPMVKMFRIGLGVRLGVVAMSSYFDIITDVLVTIAFFNSGDTVWGTASLGCVSAGIGFQAIAAWLQYNRQGPKKCASKVLQALTGLLPLTESWSVFRGEEQDKNMALPPVIMLALTKGLEIMFESLPESVIQSVFVLSSEYDDLSTLNYIGLVSSIISAGLILTDANLGIARSLIVSGPKNPVYNFLPSVKANLYTCMVGFLVFTTFYFTMTVFTIALVYLHFGGRVILYGMLTEFSIVMLYKHFADGELFALAVHAKPSKVDYILGPVIKFVYYIGSLVTYIPISKNPAELGPHVTSSLIAWRMITNPVVVVLTLPPLVNDKTLPWVTITGGLIFYFCCLVVSLIGAYIYWGYMDENHDRWRWWRRQTGKQWIEERWDAKEIWEAGCESKEEDMVSWFVPIHPLYFPMERIKMWLCIELVEKYGKKEEEGGEKKEEEDHTKEEPSNPACPEWLTQAFHDRMMEIFEWYGNEMHLADVQVALTKLPRW